MIVLLANIFLLVMSLGAIGFLSSTLVGGTAFNSILPNVVLFGAFGLFGLGVVTALIGIVSACHFRRTMLDAEEEAAKEGRCCWTFCFSFYFILLTIACIAFLACGIYGVSYVDDLTTSNAEMDAAIADAQSHKANFTTAAIKYVDTLFINYATYNPTWWYDIQKLFNCCGYFDKNLTVPPLEADYSADQTACITASQSVTDSTTNAAGCANCAATAEAATACTEEQSYDQCQRLLTGCPMYNGPACFGDNKDTACYSLVMTAVDDAGFWIGVGFLVLWLFATVIEFSALSLCCMKMCGIVRKG